MTVTVKIRNKDKLYRKFRMLAPAAEEEIEKANSRTAQEMVNLARSYAPVRTGALRASIEFTPGGMVGPAYSMDGGGRPVPEGAFLVTAGNSRVRYAHLVEYGTAPHLNSGQFAGTAHPGVMRRPFFWPAYRLVRKRHKGRISRAIRNSIKAVR